ncbi:hypothetical protein EVAR_12150_1 [Eumeta japonica]|uniref:Uncharacterized protein n=1 Tax=Eumeta variegata TaxID=151549 RepID=A0A4C1UGS1_EUMVA|nr:hypothetical protein EVAR_12150_1 [Eumeta japonica]
MQRLTLCPVFAEIRRFSNDGYLTVHLRDRSTTNSKSISRQCFAVSREFRRLTRRCAELREVTKARDTVARNCRWELTSFFFPYEFSLKKR